MKEESDFLHVSLQLDKDGLIWYPEIGDEVSERAKPEKVSIFVDPQGLTPKALRSCFVWLPTVEQLVRQFEARQAFIYHAGITESLAYETVIRSSEGVIECQAPTLRMAFGVALHELLNRSNTEHVH